MLMSMNESNKPAKETWEHFGEAARRLLQRLDERKTVSERRKGSEKIQGGRGCSDPVEIGFDEADERPSTSDVGPFNSMFTGRPERTARRIIGYGACVPGVARAGDFETDCRRPALQAADNDNWNGERAHIIAPPTSTASKANIRAHSNGVARLFICQAP